MRYLLLFCFLFLFSGSFAFVPTSSIDENNSVLKKENNSKPANKQKKKIDRKNKRQLTKQTQKLKWQLLKNVLKLNKSAKKFDQQNKKDAKPIYWSSWLSALLAVIALGFLYYVLAVTGKLLWGLFLVCVGFGVLAFIMALLSINFILRNDTEEKKDAYQRTVSILLTILGGVIGLIFSFIFILLLLLPLFIIE